MELLKHVIEIVLHLNKYLDQVIAQYGVWTHLILFAIVFCETGLVVTPFLPGDSLLFVAGTFAASGSALNIWGILVLLSAAAVLGDAVNYSIGYFFGPRLCGGGRFIKKEYLDRTHRFYEKYGKMTIILARFVPIVRTFAPFLAGVGSMRYIEFAAYNVVGGVLWVSVLTLLGYFFGNFEVVQKNFSMVIMAIIVISVLPMVIEYWRHRKDPKEEPDSGAGESA
ncbi:MAG TPA: DedA family protein [Candidatus Sumerlaeota bacterium]|nr:DedA family protein [Candidatus Sumerlaeota bacterium]